MIPVALLLLQVSGVVGADAPPLPVIPRDHGAGGWPAEVTTFMHAAADVPWYPGSPQIRFAIPQSRYNRIEALSFAVVAGRELPRDRTLSGLLRLGGADLVPNGEVQYARERGRVKSVFAVYHRLDASNMWGNPLALGHSLGALVIGRDEGFYYRAGGAEFRYSDSVHSNFEGRVFVERHRTARVKNDFSFADMFGDRDFHPNIVATEGDVAGLAARVSARRGDLPTEKRYFGEARFESAVGDFDYARMMVEGIASVPLSGTFLASLTVSAGSSAGEVPVHRTFFIGGSRSARGQPSGVMSGDAFWMAQAEVGTLDVFARPVLFFDAGWAGSRDSFTSPGRIATGAGIGFSMFDGSLRFDLARGLWPGTAVRGMLYLEARM